MWRLLKERPRAFVYAVLVHLALVGLFVVSFEWTAKPRSSGDKKPDIVQAVAVDESRVKQEIQRLEAEEKRKERAAAERLRKLEEQTRKAEEKRKKEQKRLADLKKKQEEEREQVAKQKEMTQALEKKRRAEEGRLADLEAKRKAEEAVRKKAEAEAKRKVAEDVKRKAAAEVKRKAAEEAKRKAAAEVKRKAAEEAKRKAAAEAKRKAEEEVKRKEAEKAMQEQLAAERAHIQAEKDAANQRVVDQYTDAIRQKVQRNWIKPASAHEGLSCTVKVQIIPGGDVVAVSITSSSGNASFDRSVEAAVYRASPMPLPEDAALFNYFRDLTFKFKP